MSRDGERVRLLACEGKTRHQGKAQALRAIGSLRQGGRLGRRGVRTTLRAYRCPHCGGWHIGSKPGVGRA